VGPLQRRGNRATRVPGQELLVRGQRPASSAWLRIYQPAWRAGSVDTAASSSSITGRPTIRPADCAVAALRAHIPCVCSAPVPHASFVIGPACRPHSKANLKQDRLLLLGRRNRWNAVSGGSGGGVEVQEAVVRDVLLVQAAMWLEVVRSWNGGRSGIASVFPRPAPGRHRGETSTSRSCVGSSPTTLGWLCTVADQPGAGAEVNQNSLCPFCVASKGAAAGRCPSTFRWQFAGHQRTASVSQGQLVGDARRVRFGQQHGVALAWGWTAQTVAKDRRSRRPTNPSRPSGRVDSLYSRKDESGTKFGV